VLLAACGGSSDASDTEARGPYELRVVRASFPPRQLLGQTSLLRLGIRNVGDERVPSLTVTIGIASKQGEASRLPFGVRDPQPGLAQPDRPVWVLAATYPRLADTDEPGGAETAGLKTFDFGPLEPGETLSAVWKLSAVRQGRYAVRYRIGADLTGEAKARTVNGAEPGGTFVAEISRRLPEVEVTDSGDVVPRKQLPGGAG